jgi:hypothetical protein
MKPKKIATFFLVIIVINFLGLTFLSKPAKDHTAKSLSIEGTYKFLWRKLPNGQTIKPPMAMGLQTFTKEYRNFNVMWVDSSGKHFSFSVVSKYKLTDKEYTETVMYYVMNDEIGMMKKGITYVTNQTKSSPVEMKDGKITVKLPFDPPTVTFDGNKLTATAEGMFTDYWEKVQ